MHRLLIAPWHPVFRAAQRIGGGTERCQPDHLGREPGIASNQFGRLAALSEKLSDKTHRHPRTAEDWMAAANITVGEHKKANAASIAQRRYRLGRYAGNPAFPS